MKSENLRALVLVTRHARLAAIAGLSLACAPAAPIVPARETRHVAKIPCSGASPSSESPRPTALGEPAEMAFKTGDDSAEHIWIRGASGNLVHVSRWAPDPRVSWAFSYPDESWRFGQPKFEHTGTFLLFWEALHKADRLLAYDLSTGISREILRAPTPSAESRLGVSFYKDPLVVDGATVVLVRDNREDRPRIFDIVEGEPIPVDAVIDAPKDVFTGSNERLLHFRGAPLLIARGIVPIEKRDGRFTRSSILEGLTGIGGVNDSPSDDRLCAVDDWKPRRRCGHILGGPNPITVPIMPNAGECGLGDARTP